MWNTAISRIEDLKVYHFDPPVISNEGAFLSRYSVSLKIYDCGESWIYFTSIEASDRLLSLLVKKLEFVANVIHEKIKLPGAFR
jgi:hypothetical protein